MDLARRAGLAALIVVALVASTSGPGGSPVIAATVGWPTSALVLSEILAGGISASDEFVEIANQGATAVDLAGLEVIYATASGSTVTQKARWDVSTVVAPGLRLLLANASGSAAAFADAVYSGGFAATGGVLALRVIGGPVVDSVGWGDAANDLVEGVATSAPPAGSSLERRPGGAAGNAIDTNDNASDWFVQGSPSPQGLSDAPVPIVSPTGSPGASATPASSPTPSATATATASPTPSPTPSSTQSPAPLPIADARALPDGTAVAVQGVLTTDLGHLESGRGGFIQDLSGGIAIYLDALPVDFWPAGTTVVLHGSVSSRFSQRTLRLSEAGIERGVLGAIPTAVSIATGDASETFEGTRVSVAGTIIGSPGALADGIGVTLDDGSGPLRAVIGTEAVADQVIAAGMTAIISGPLGQRDSSGTGSAGYRIHATLSDELLVAEATPTPSPTPRSSPTPTPTPRVSGSPTPTASMSQPYVAAQAVTAVRAMAVGARVNVTAVVVAEKGRLGTPALIAVGDDTAGIAVRLPTGATGFAEGTLLQVSGTLAAPYGQLEIRAATDDVHAIGTGALPMTIDVGSGGAGETIEGRLATLTGTISTKPKRSAEGDLTITFERSGASSITVIADASSQVTADDFTVGATYRVVGVVGQRATRKGSLDGYRICLRKPADAVVLAGAVRSAGGAGAGASARPTGSAGASNASSPSIRIAKAIGLVDQLVTIEAIVTAPGTLLDATGRRIVVQDASAAIELLLPGDLDAPSVGTRIRAEGRIGRAYGAPRLRAERLTDLGSGPIPAPLTVRGAPGHDQQWRLVTVTGRIDDVRKLGDRWRAELLVAASRVVVVGQPGSGIAVTAVDEGRMATVTGIVRAPYPTASDQRYAILPRSSADLRIAGSRVITGVRGSGSAAHPGVPATEPGRSVGPQPVGVVGVDLVDLAAFGGQVVRVGGLIVDLRPDGVLLDDGTAIGLVVVRGAARELLSLLEPDDAVNATGHVEKRSDGSVVVVDDPGGIVQAGDPVALATGPIDDGAAAPGAGGSALPAPPSPSQRSGFLDGTSIGAGLVSLGALVLLSLASLAVTFGRRGLGRRRLEQAAAVRLAAFEASSSPLPAPRSAERDGSPFHSA